MVFADKALSNSAVTYSDFLSEPYINIHVTIQTEESDTWVYVENKRPCTQELSDSMVLVDMPQQAPTEQTCEYSY